MASIEPEPGDGRGGSHVGNVSTSPRGGQSGGPGNRDLSPAEAAVELGCCYEHVLRQIKLGTLAAYRVGKRAIRIERRALDAFRRNGGAA